MTFPQTDRDVAVEIFVNNTWTDITSDVFQRNAERINIVRGKPSADAPTAPSHCDLVVNNEAGKYSPRNPLGAYYGQFGRNTPLRVGIKSTALRFDEFGGDEFCSAPDSAGLSIATDMDVRIDATIDAPDGWDQPSLLMSKWGAAGQRSWYFAIVAVGDETGLRFVRSTDGTASTTFDSTETIPGPVTGRRAFRVSFARDNGAGGANCTFYVGDDIDEPVWQQLGDTVTVAGVANTFDSTASVTIGYNANLGFATLLGAVHECLILGDLGAITTKASPDFTAQTAGAASFVDAQGNTWTPGNGAALASTIHRLARFHGEVSALPPRWDVSGNAASVPITAAGILRRVGQGTQPVNSGLKQYLLTTDPVIYWPLTEGSTSTSGAPAVGTHPFGRFIGTGQYKFGTFELAPYLGTGLWINDLQPDTAAADFLQGYTFGSDALPDSLTWEFLYRVDEENTGSVGDWLFRATIAGTTSGTFDRWEVQFRSDGTNNDIRLVLETNVGPSSTVVNLADTAALAAVTDGELHHVRLQLTESGANVAYAVYLDGASVISGTRNTHTLRGLWDVSVYYDRAAGEDAVAIGHIAVWENAANTPALADTFLAASGFAGETAGRRIERLCLETGTPFASDGDLDDTMAMGLQYTDYFSNQLAEIEQTDRGLVYEPRDVLALGYRTRADLYNQTAKATINYAAGELAPPLDPIDDDQNTRNDIFAQRRDGGSYQATLETGPLSVQDPPDGVGRYKDEQQVNVETDDMLPPMAGWLLHVGTVDEARYAQLTVNLANSHVAANTTLSQAILAADIGDRIVITNTDDLNVYDDISLIVIGYTEAISPREHSITFNCMPESPYRVLELDLADARIDPGDGASLSAGISSSANSFTVTCDGFLWTTDAGQMPISIMIGGEEMSVGAISGAASPQTFSSVTRSVNGVVKAHSAGAIVRLKRPAILAL